MKGREKVGGKDQEQSQFNSRAASHGIWGSRLKSHLHLGTNEEQVANGSKKRHSVNEGFESDRGGGVPLPIVDENHFFRKHGVIQIFVEEKRKFVAQRVVDLDQLFFTDGKRKEGISG